MKSGSRAVKPEREGNSRCGTGIVVVFMINSFSARGLSLRGPGQQQAGDLGLGRVRGRLQRDVAGHDNDRNPAPANSFADCDFERARHLVSAGNEFAVMAAFLEEALGVCCLEVSGADLGRGNVRRNG